MKVFLRRIVGSIILSILSATSLADFSRGEDYAGGTDTFEQRQLYLDAIHLIRTSQITRFSKLKPRLRTYALYPYLDYTEMSYRISRQSEADILAFVEQNQDTPLTGPLLQNWLGSLAKRNKWALFLKHYDRVTPTKALACHHGFALHKAGREVEAMARARELWLVDFSQPDECDPIFRVWRGNGGLTDELAWQRLAMSLQANERDLSAYLLRYIDKKDKPSATKFRLVHTKPETVKRTQTFRTQHIHNRQIILHGIKRLARNHPEDALNTLQRYQAMHDFDPDQLEETYAKVGIALALQSDKPELSEGLPVNLHDYPALAEAQLRQSMKLEDWGNVIVLINLLPEELQSSARWQYWKARVLSQSDDAVDQKSAYDTMIELGRERTFYGFLSADLLGNTYNYQDEPRQVTQDQILSMEQTPGIQRALELFALGERSRARREWYFTTSDFTEREREVAARVALRWGWYKAAIQSMIDAQAWNHLDFRFPVAFQDTFIEHARRANIPVQWSLAIARQESAFMPDAKSPSGALGVMQLMPSTAKLVAGKLGVKYASNRSLTEPGLNIKLGTHYLGQMLRRFDNNRILASAAYNAGPSRVNRWLDPSVPFDVWIEIIPFTETRNYVQNVLMFSSIYTRRMEEPAPFIYPHERASFSPRQITVAKPKKTPENT